MASSSGVTRWYFCSSYGSTVTRETTPLVTQTVSPPCGAAVSIKRGQAKTLSGHGNAVPRYEQRLGLPAWCGQGRGPPGLTMG